MWIADLKIVLSFCICTALAYHGPKQDYLKWRERFLPKMPPTTPSSDLVTSENDISYENLKLKHHSRYPNLDRVMDKIDSMGGHKVRHQGGYSLRGSYRSTTSTTTTAAPEDIFGEDYENYGDDNNDYDELEDEDGINFDDDVGEEEDPFADEDEFQAEEASDSIVSSVTQLKWDNYGTRSKVEQSRRKQLNLKISSEHPAIKEAVDHVVRVRHEGQCRRPQPKVVSVQSIHPNSSKSYTPHCTILHLCAEDTGCCNNYQTRCGPKSQVPVYLYFYVKTLGVMETKVEKLRFYNHTECACLEKNKPPAPTTLSAENLLSNSGLSLRSATQPGSMRHCKCPEMFVSKFRNGERCVCDCEFDDQDCIQMQKGKEYLGMSDRKCILEGKCGTPVCEYGVYLREIGRCQQKQEKLDSYKRVSIK